jgi:hypothetical protein
MERVFWEWNDCLLGSVFAQGGILAKNIKRSGDCSSNIISGYDPKDATSIKVEVPNFSERL